MRNATKSFVGAALLTAALLMTAACGSSSDDSGPSGQDVSADVSVAPGDATVDLGGGDTPGKEDSGVSDVALDVDEDTAAEDAGAQDEDVREVCLRGTRCDDGNPCTFDDRCNEFGDCVGEHYTCADGRLCTRDECDGHGDCRFILRDGSCLIGGYCLEDGEVSERDPCLRCDAEASPTAWAGNDGADCDDGDPCTSGDVCGDGACQPGSDGLDCGSVDQQCAEVACVAGVGCVVTPLPGFCDDGNSCTEDGVCADGVCQVGAPLNCSDDNPCTADTCQPGEGCVHTPIAGVCDDGNACTIGDACSNGRCVGDYDTLRCLDGDPCTFDFCDPDTGACVNTVEGNTMACEDGDVCTIGDRCQAGACMSGEPRSCDDHNDCTEDSCLQAEGDFAGGCFHLPLDGGCCANGQNICDDDNPCTDDFCLDEGGCVNEYNSNPCDDGNVCTTGDTCLAGECVGIARDCDDDNPCTTDSCLPASGCQHTAIGGDCDDNNVCTVNDRCTAGTCTGAFIDCTDTNACTDDICDPQTGCQNPFNSEPCDDGDVCTMDDRCTNGSCVGVPNTCDDGDPCTADSCDPVLGCLHSAASGVACDDGIDCTVADTCVDGVCVGDDSACVCLAPPGATLAVTALQIGTSGRPGQGLDLDQNPNTCAPPGSCSDGINNAMGVIAGFANPEITEALAEGSFYLLFQLEDFTTDGQPFPFNGYTADPVDPGCAHQSSVCDYMLSNSVFDDDCNPMIALSNATTDGQVLSVGGVGHDFAFTIPFMEGLDIELLLYNATIEGTITMSGGRVTRMSGILGGAVPKAVISDALQAVDPEDLPMPPETILGLLDTLVRDDIDVDGDGTPDAASIGIVFEAIEANIAGTSPD